MFNNMIKYSIIYKYGGIWLPCSTVVVDKFYIDEDPYIDGKLIFFTEKKREHNRYFNRFDFSAIASIKETTQVKYLLDKLKENITTFNYSPIMSVIGPKMSSTSTTMTKIATMNHATSN